MTDLQVKKSINGIQTVEVIVNNAGPEWISGKGVEVSIEASGIIMVETATITRLRPGDQRKVDVKLTGEGNVTAKVILQGTNTTVTNTFENVTFGLAHWTEDASSLTLHESPNWFNDAKFGIFIRRLHFCRKLTSTDNGRLGCICSPWMGELNTL